MVVSAAWVRAKIKVVLLPESIGLARRCESFFFFRTLRARMPSGGGLTSLDFGDIMVKNDKLREGLWTGFILT